MITHFLDLLSAFDAITWIPFGVGLLLDLAANLGFGLSGAYGSKPQVVQWKPLSLGSEQKKSVLGNISNFGDIAKLGDLFTQYMVDQQNQLLPGYSDVLAKGEADTSKLLDVAGSELSGNLPPDVISEIERSDAFQSLSGGYAGSQMGRNLTARDLGLTSLDLMRQGASMLGQGGNSAQQWASMAKGDILNPATEFVSPQDTAQFDLQNQLLKLSTLQNKFNVAAAPDPALVGASNAVGSTLGQLTSAGGILGSSGGGGSGGGGGGGILSLLMGLI